MKKFFVKILGNERTQNIAIPLFSILLSLIVGMIVIAALGKYPLTAYANLLQGSGLLPKPQYSAYQGMLTDFTSFLNMMTPMLFAALAVAVALKAGLFNIGVSGQMLAAGFIATITVGYSTLAAPIAKPLVLLIGIAAGMAVGGLIGFLKYKFNINEVVSSIMINYIVQYLTSFFINTRYMDEISRQSLAISDNSRLTIMEVPIGGLRVDIPLCIILAVLVAVVMKFLLDRTRLGFEIKAVGASRNAARYAGINVGKTMILSMMISGALAGLAGGQRYRRLYAGHGIRRPAHRGADRHRCESSRLECQVYHRRHQNGCGQESGDSHRQRGCPSTGQPAAKGKSRAVRLRPGQTVCRVRRDGAPHRHPPTAPILPAPHLLHPPAGSKARNPPRRDQQHHRSQQRKTGRHLWSHQPANET